MVSYFIPLTQHVAESKYLTIFQEYSYHSLGRNGANADDFFAVELIFIPEIQKAMKHNKTNLRQTLQTRDVLALSVYE